MIEKLKKVRDCVRKKTGYGSLIEVYGLSELLVTGTLSLIDFSDTRVVVDTVDGVVCVFGLDLEMTACRADIVCVSGNIRGIEVDFCDR